MRFHVPKPLHGWRELVGEVGIIVLGVLIALGAGQVVESIHDRRVADQTRGSVTDEINTNLASLYLRRAAEPCIDRRLAELRRIFDDWQLTGSFKTPLWVAQATSGGIDLTRYDAALASGHLAILPSDQQYALGGTANGLRDFAALVGEELRVWGRLRALQAGPRALSAGDQAQLRMALQDAATLDYQVKLAEQQVLASAASHGLRPDFTQFRMVAKNAWKSGRFTPSICVSIGTPPAKANEISGQRVPLPF